MLDGLRLLGGAWRVTVVVSNQNGIALGRFDHVALQRLACAMCIARAAWHRTRGYYACSHASSPLDALPCGCRKSAADDFDFDLERSWMVDDILDNAEAGHAAGCRSAPVDAGNETVWRLAGARTPDFIATDFLAAAHATLRRDAVGAKETAS